MRTLWVISGCVLVLMAYQRPAAAQTMVEYGAAAGASGTASTGAKGVGTAIGGMFDSLNKTLDQAPNQAAPGQVRKAEPASHPLTASPAKPKDGTPGRGPAAPKPVYEDAVGIQKGMSCDEVLHRFGPPAMAFAGEDDSKSMSYASKAGGVQVECQAGKVASVDKPSAGPGL